MLYITWRLPITGGDLFLPDIIQSPDSWYLSANHNTAVTVTWPIKANHRLDVAADCCVNRAISSFVCSSVILVLLAEKCLQSSCFVLDIQYRTFNLVLRKFSCRRLTAWGFLHSLHCTDSPSHNASLNSTRSIIMSSFSFTLYNRTGRTRSSWYTDLAWSF